MALPLWAALSLGGMGLGALKSEFIDKPAEKRERINQSTVMRYSPWTGLKPEAVKESSALGEAMQWAGTGAAMGQNIEQFGVDQKLKERMTEELLPRIRTMTERSAAVAADAPPPPKGLEVKSIEPATETASAEDPEAIFDTYLEALRARRKLGRKL